MNKGTLIISLDTELAWGWLSHKDQCARLEPLFNDTKRVITRLLDLFERYNIPVTWAIVGRLLDFPAITDKQRLELYDTLFPGMQLEAIYNNNEFHSVKHSILLHLILIEQIKKYRVDHDIGSHTYSHPFFGNYGPESRELIRSDINLGIKSVEHISDQKPVSFVFPGNQPGFEDVLYDEGIRVVRGVNGSKYKTRLKILRIFLNRLDLLLPNAAAVVSPYQHISGLIVIPGSHLFRVSDFGLRRFIPIQLLSIKGIKSLKVAVREGGVYHLWFHPFNFVHREEQHFKELEKVLKLASKLRDSGDLEIRSMSSYAELVKSD